MKILKITNYTILHKPSPKTMHADNDWVVDMMKEGMSVENFWWSLDD